MSEGTTRQEPNQQGSGFIEIQAPEYLNREQNLYDQEPFVSIVDRISQAFGITPDTIRFNISYYAKLHLKQTRVNPNYQSTDLRYEKDLSDKHYSLPIEPKLALFQGLQGYFGWSEYLVDVNNRQYTRTGSPNPSVQPKGGYTSTYPHWLSRKKQSWLVGIKHIFPEDVGHPVTSQPNITGVKPSNRIWRIRKAAGFGSQTR